VVAELETGRLSLQDYLRSTVFCRPRRFEPAERLYRLALQLTRREPERCVFIEDRAINLVCAARLGLHTIEFRGADELRAELERLGIGVPAPAPA
jgi:HAD superfamily hydrolase (TIGR01509 family)